MTPAEVPIREHEITKTKKKNFIELSTVENIIEE